MLIANISSKQVRLMTPTLRNLQMVQVIDSMHPRGFMCDKSRTYYPNWLCTGVTKLL